MLRRARTPLLLFALLLALLSGSYWLWRDLRPLGKAGDAGAPGSASSRKALETLTQDASSPANPPPASEPQRSARERVAREPNRTEAAADSTATLTGQLLDLEGRAAPGAQLLLASWIEDPVAPSASHSLDDSPFATWTASAAEPRIPARIAVHLPIDLADPAAVGLPVPLRFRPDDSGNFRIPLPPGRWRLLVRSSLAPYERNDLLLAAGEQRDLGRILLRPGVTYRFELRNSRGAKASDIRAAPLLSGLGAAFPPLTGALALPFLRAPPVGDEPWLSLPQRPVPLSLWLDAPHSRALRLALDPSKPKLALSLPDADHLVGALAHPETLLPGTFAVHARPLDFFDSPIPPELRADVAHAAASGHDFDIELPERSTLYELRASFGEEPPLLPSPWSPPRFAASPSSADPRAQQDLLRDSLIWRADAQLHLELASSLPSSVPAELFFSGVYVRGSTPGQPIELPSGAQLLSGLRLLRHPEPHLFLRVPGTQVLEQPLPLVAGNRSDLGRLELSALPSLSLSITDSRTSRAISGATVRALEDFPNSPPEPTGPLLALSDSRGLARAFVTSLELSLLEIRAPDYAPAFVPARERLSDGTLRVRLQRGATVRVRVFDSDAAPLRAATVECTRAEWTPDLGPPALTDSRTTDVLGYVTFPRVTPGKHSFRIRSSHKLLPSEWSILDLADESTRELSLATRTRSRLTVRVATPAGPRPDVLLTLESASLLPLDPSARCGDLPLDPSPLCADDPLPYGVDAYTDSRGEAHFDDLEPDPIRLTLTLPDSPLRLRRTLRLRPGPQTFTIDPSESIHQTLLASDSTPPLDLRLQPAAIPLPLDDDPLPLATLDLEHTSRLDRRLGNPDLTLPDPTAISLPADLERQPLLLTTPQPNLALLLTPDPTLSAAPSLIPTTSLDLTLLSLRPGERYVVLLGRSSTPTSLSDSAADTFLLERTFPFVASSPSLTFTLSHLLPGTTTFRLYRLLPTLTTLLPESPPQSLDLSSTPARLRLSTRN